MNKKIKQILTVSLILGFLIILNTVVYPSIIAEDNTIIDLLLQRTEDLEGRVTKLELLHDIEPPCIEDWQCTEWSECNSLEVQTRVCTDTNSCGTEDNKLPETQPCVYDFCQDITCQPSEQTCEDGFVATCENTCDEGSCSDCAPDCMGHDLPTCVENWSCTSWTECQQDEAQTRICTDLNSCGTEDNKLPETQPCVYDFCQDITCQPSEQTCEDGFVATCENVCTLGVCSECTPDCTGHDLPPCIEDWQCTEWSECDSSQTQTRTCEDLNSCGTQDNKPSETQSCDYDFCQDITCQPSEQTCEDGYLATCENTCSLGVCSDCTPDCTGHDLPSDKGVIVFQLDDIQAWWLEDVAEKLVEIHIEEEIPVTLGVVAKGLNYRVSNPDSIANDLKRWHNNNRDIVETAVHTYDHDDYSRWSLNRQTRDIKKGKRIFNNMGIEVTTFVPAYNWGNSNTAQAILNAGLRIGLDAGDNPYIDSMDNPMILENGIWYDYGFSSWDFNSIEDRIDLGIEKEGYFIIGYHQQDFSSNSEFTQFANFLQDMKDSNKYTFMTTKQYYEYKNG